jgi:hypothetical protein
VKREEGMGIEEQAAIEGKEQWTGRRIFFSRRMIILGGSGLLLMK